MKIARSQWTSLPTSLRTWLLGLSGLLALAAAVATAACDDVNPQACVVDGESHALGTTFPSSDGCNTCACGRDGVVNCTARACVTTCQYNGATWQVNDTFPAIDGCNSCTCLPSGDVGCTVMACVCDPSAEWWRDYHSTSASECAAMLFACPEHTTNFSNECGCGCQQETTCGKVIACAPPGCDPAAAQAECPFSTIDSTRKCQVESPCPSDGSMCFAPGASIGCGICQNPPEEETCADDAACAEGSICQPLQCACSGQKTCVPGCTANGDCGLGKTCSAGHRCVPAACGTGAPCPADFGCAGGACVRRACTTSAACDGVCVNGQCFAEPGFCSFLPP
ncbi:MAG: hypothetical protein U1F43_02200 [Myxococcota bacterium]